MTLRKDIHFVSCSGYICSKYLQQLYWSFLKGFLLSILPSILSIIGMGFAIIS